MLRARGIDDITGLRRTLQGVVMAIDRMSRIAVVAFVLCVASTVMPDAARSDEAAALHAKVEELSRQGKYAEAIPIAERELAVFERAFGPDLPTSPQR